MKMLRKAIFGCHLLVGNVAMEMGIVFVLSDETKMLSHISMRIGYRLDGRYCE